MSWNVLITPMGQLNCPLPTFCSQNQVPLFSHYSSPPPPLEQKPALGCCEAVDNVSTVFNRNNDYKQSVFPLSPCIFFPELKKGTILMPQIDLRVLYLQMEQLWLRLNTGIKPQKELLVC